VLKFCTGLLCKTLSIRREFVQIGLATAVLELYLFFPRSAQRLTTGWTVRGWNPCSGEIFCTWLDWPWGPLSHLCSGYQLCFPGLKRSRRGVDQPPHLTLRLSVRAFPILPCAPSYPFYSGLHCTFLSLSDLHTLLWNVRKAVTSLGVEIN